MIAKLLLWPLQFRPPRRLNFCDRIVAARRLTGKRLWQALPLARSRLGRLRLGWLGRWIYIFKISGLRRDLVR